VVLVARPADSLLYQRMITRKTFDRRLQSMRNQTVRTSGNNHSYLFRFIRGHCSNIMLVERFSIDVDPFSIRELSVPDCLPIHSTRKDHLLILPSVRHKKAHIHVQSQDTGYPLYETENFALNSKTDFPKSSNFRSNQ
jgi:hypothetical protein